ncbi:T9SS type A sorting domain-containing protein [Algibacter mikhailovii]
MTIHDLNGKLINTVDMPLNKINLRNLSSGVYFLKFKIDNVHIMKRLIKE